MPEIEEPLKSKPKGGFRFIERTAQRQAVLADKKKTIGSSPMVTMLSLPGLTGQSYFKLENLLKLTKQNVCFD